MKTKQRTLTVLLAMVLVLGGLLWLITRSNAAEEAASSAAAEGSILLSSFAAGDAEQIRYTYQNETITLNCDSGSWTLADDPGYHLDASACNTMALVLERALSGYAVAAFPMAKNTGLAHTFATAADQTTVRRVLMVLAALLSAALLALGGWALVLAALAVLWRYHAVSRKQFGGITGDLAGWFLQKAELWMLAALCACQWGGLL